MWINSLYNTSKLTVELRELVENGVDIWDFEYPSYYEGEQKKAFEQKVIDHYLFRQIGQETVGRWLHYFRTRMREIMPYYIQLYKSCELMENLEDPFESYNLTETYTEEKTGNGKITGSDSSEASSETSGTGSNNKTSSSSRDGVRKFSNTPHGSIDNIENYMSEASKENEITDGSETDNITSSGTGSVSSSGSSERLSEDSETIKHTLTRKGNIGVQPLGKEVEALRHSFLNVDMLVINELKDLFLQVY